MRLVIAFLLALALVPASGWALSCPASSKKESDQFDLILLGQLQSNAAYRNELGQLKHRNGVFLPLRVYKGTYRVGTPLQFPEESGAPTLVNGQHYLLHVRAGVVSYCPYVRRYENPEDPELVEMLEKVGGGE